MRPTIRIELLSKVFGVLWLKYVRTFDPAEHCAKCLVGRYSSLIPFRGRKPGNVFEGYLDEHSAPFVYLCGVARRWSDNVHIAMRPKQGAAFTFDDPRLAVRVEGMERLEIPAIEGIDLPEAFATCRNYQFGHAYVARLAGQAYPTSHIGMGHISTPQHDSGRQPLLGGF
jgi:hypothetical protein